MMSRQRDESASGMHDVRSGGHRAIVWIAQPALREGHGSGGSLPAARAFGRTGEGYVGIELRQQGVELGKGLDQRQRASQIGSGGKPVQVPGDVFADVAHALVLAEVGGEE